MKRIVKIFAAVIVAAIGVALLVKQESFLEAHYDTGERRNIQRTSFLGIETSESTAWTKDGYRKQYLEIFGDEPSDLRWHSLSMRPIISSQFLSEHHWSVMTPRAVSLRDSLVRRIFERYQRDQSTDRAREALSELDMLLPSTERLETFDYEDIQSARQKAKEIPSLQDLID